MTDATSAPAAPEPKSSWWLLFRVLDEPGQVFRQLTQRPRVLLAMLVIAVVSGGALGLAPASVLRRMGQQRIDAVAKRAPDSFTPETRQQILERSTSLSSRLLVAVPGAVGSMIVLLIAAAILLGVFSLTGADLTYKTELAIAAHSYVPALIGLLVTIGLAPMTGGEMQQYGLGFLFDAETSPFLHRFGNAFTIFTAWQVYLLAVGNQIATKAKGIGGTLAILLSLWVVLALAVSALGGLVPGAGG